MAINPKEHCIDCGQTLKEGLCKRCDELCAWCEQARRTHLNINGKEFCFNIFFKGTGVFNDSARTQTEIS